MVGGYHLAGTPVPTLIQDELVILAKCLQQVVGKLHRLGLEFVYLQVAASMSTRVLILNNIASGSFLSPRDPEQSTLFPAYCLRS